MKIAVIGTSNSVLKSGYFETYKALEHPHQTDLFAVGGTIVSYAAFALEYYGILAEYDVIVTEFSTNDTNRYKKNVVSLEYLAQYIYDVFALIHSAGKIHINLLLGHPTTEKDCPVFGIYRSICKMFGTENIEGHELVSSFEKSGEIWLDENHYQSSAARKLAFVLHGQRKKLTDKAQNTHKNDSPAPIRKFFAETFKDSPNLRIKGTTLYTLPTLPVEKKISVPLKQDHIHTEGFFYRASPFIGNISLACSEKIYGCDLFRAASGFFYHYLPQNGGIPVSGRTLELHNGKILSDGQNRFNGFEYNPKNFELCGILFSAAEPNSTYPAFAVLNAEPSENTVKNYGKIFSVVRSCAASAEFAEKISDPVLLFAAAEALEEENRTKAIYKRVCVLSEFKNPFFVKKYLIRLLADNDLQEIKAVLPLLENTDKNCLSAELFACFSKLGDKQAAEKTAQNEKNPLKRLSLLASFFLGEKEYEKAEKLLIQCRTINDENLHYVNDLLFCLIQLGKKEEIQTLLAETEKYVIQCAGIQYRLDFTDLQNSMNLLTKEDCGPYYPFVGYLKKCGFRLTVR